ncbi:MAG: hypothetical protein GXY07_09875 [Candidatus Hydrogenedentes bacterium]|nr:hypothetical protein [Candidatus Hydrogenedentota bacterium]
METLIAILRVYDWGGDRGSLMAIDASIVAAYGNAEKLAEIEQALLEVLQSEAPIPAKEYICRQLALIGTDRCVPVLAAMLPDAELSDQARLALEAIPTTLADEALRAALDKVEGDQRAGIVNSLDERKKRLVTSTEHLDANEIK